MNIKNKAYYWTNKANVESIKEQGIFTSGGRLQQGAYLCVNPLKFYNPEHKLNNKNDRDALFVVDLRGIESKLVFVSDKKWLISTTKIPSQNIQYVGTDFENEDEIRLQLHEAKEAFDQNFHRSQYKLEATKIKPYESYFQRNFVN